MKKIFKMSAMALILMFSMVFAAPQQAQAKYLGSRVETGFGGGLGMMITSYYDDCCIIYCYDYDGNYIGAHYLPNDGGESKNL